MRESSQSLRVCNCQQDLITSSRISRFGLLILYDLSFIKIEEDLKKVLEGSERVLFQCLLIVQHGDQDEEITCVCGLGRVCLLIDPDRVPIIVSWGVRWDQKGR